MAKEWDWNPWLLVDDKQALIEAPPCQHCYYWNPRTVYGKKGNIEGVRCCDADDMFHDFSCYQPKGQ